MTYSIFYSWQSDSKATDDRKFIRDAIDGAIASNSASVTPSPRVESDMEGIAGSPEIATVLLKKIERSAIFVGDVTLVGRMKASEKLLPNPNVLLELGYAARVLGWERVILIMNEEYGEQTELPFDFRNKRFPIPYKLADGISEGVRTQKLKALSGRIRFAIQTSEQCDLEAAYDAIGLLNIECITLALSHGKQDSFASKEEDRSAISRLLDLKLIETWVEPSAGYYGYEWTYLGKMVLPLLNARLLPNRVVSWSERGFVLSDGRIISLPGFRSLPRHSLALGEATKRGVEIDASGAVFGIVRVDRWRTDRPLREEMVRINVAKLLLFLGEGELTEPAKLEQRSADAGQFSQTGWKPEQYEEFKKWLDD